MRMSPIVESVDPLYHKLRETAEKCAPGGNTVVGYLHGDLVYIALLEPDGFRRVWHFTAASAITIAASLFTQGEYAMIANGMSHENARTKVQDAFYAECNRIIEEWNERATNAKKSEEAELVSDDLIGLD